MSSILYYSKHCPNCQRLLGEMAKSSEKDDMHFICIDDRVAKENGATYVRLRNQQELLLPPTITKVPALLLLNKGHHVLFGQDIERHLAPKKAAAAATATGDAGGEPQAFSFGGFAGYGVASDTFSFLDQDSDQLSARGEGGMRQQHHYAKAVHADNIDTPPDTYQPDKVGPKTLEGLESARASALEEARTA